MRTEDLLKQSQSLAIELQTQQEELQLTNQELEEKATLLAEQNVEVERKNEEVEQARKALEEKAEQLALTSKYKSEFLANMSHELRTPLNSLLILSDQLARNPERNLTARQVEFAKTIHESGNDLLALINDILDLSKIESGTVTLDIGEVSFRELRDYVERTFRHVAEAKSLAVHRATSTTDLPSSFDDRREAPPAGPQEPALERLQVHRARHGRDPGRRPPRPAGAPTTSRSSRARSVVRVLGRPTPASASRRRSSRSSSRRSSRPTAARAAATAAPASVSRSAARSRRSSAARSGSRARRAMGSTFTLYLPATYAPAKASAPRGATGRTRTLPKVIVAQPRARAGGPAGARCADQVDDDRDVDPARATLRADRRQRHGVRALPPRRGARPRLQGHRHGAAERRRSRSRGSSGPAAITLDIRLPDMDGWRVLGPPEGRPRHAPHPGVRHLDGRRAAAVPAGGAATSSAKPVDEGAAGTAPRRDRRRPGRTDAQRLLLVEDDDIQRRDARRVARRGRPRGRRRGDRRRGPARSSSASRSTASSPTSGCPTCTGRRFVEQVRSHPARRRLPDRGLHRP